MQAITIIGSNRPQILLNRSNFWDAPTMLRQSRIGPANTFNNASCLSIIILPTQVSIRVRR
jgi:hypothetical protein